MNSPPTTPPLFADIIFEALTPSVSASPSQRLVEDPFGVFALILTPTRELAIQIADQFRALGSGSRLRTCVVIGGVEMTAQAQRLSGRPHVVIATPGRLRDHLQSDPAMASVFSNIRFLVLDEADRLLDSGFESEISAVLQVAPEGRQTLLFSATITTNLRALGVRTGGKVSTGGGDREEENK